MDPLVWCQPELGIAIQSTSQSPPRKQHFHPFWYRPTFSTRHPRHTCLFLAKSAPHLSCTPHTPHRLGSPSTTKMDGTPPGIQYPPGGHKRILHPRTRNSRSRVHHTNGMGHARKRTHHLGMDQRMAPLPTRRYHRVSTRICAVCQSTKIVARQLVTGVRSRRIVVSFFFF